MKLNVRKYYSNVQILENDQLLFKIVYEKRRYRGYNSLMEQIFEIKEIHPWFTVEPKTKYEVKFSNNLSEIYTIFHKGPTYTFIKDNNNYALYGHKDCLRASIYSNENQIGLSVRERVTFGQKLKFELTLNQNLTLYEVICLYYCYLINEEAGDADFTIVVGGFGNREGKSFNPDWRPT